MQPYLSAEQALELHKNMTRYIATMLSSNNAWHYTLWMSQSHVFFDQLAGELNIDLVEQKGADLGQRLQTVVSTFFSDSAPGALVLVGSDCPALSSHHVQQVFDCLNNKDIDLAIVPATDGGYVALGLKAPLHSLFKGISWGSADVLNETLAQAERESLNYQTLNPLPDIDRPEDLRLIDGLLDFPTD